MVLRTVRKKIAVGIELDMSAQDMRNRALAEIINGPSRARTIGIDVVDQQPAWQQEVAREQQRRPVVIEQHVFRMMPRRWQHLDDSLTQVQPANSFRPMFE